MFSPPQVETRYTGTESKLYICIFFLGSALWRWRVFIHFSLWGTSSHCWGGGLSGRGRLVAGVYDVMCSSYRHEGYGSEACGAGMAPVLGSLSVLVRSDARGGICVRKVYWNFITVFFLCSIVLCYVLLVGVGRCVVLYLSYLDEN